jgi:hypothetical protein
MAMIAKSDASRSLRRPPIHHERSMGEFRFTLGPIHRVPGSSRSAPVPSSRGFESVGVKEREQALLTQETSNGHGHRRHSARRSVDRDWGIARASTLRQGSTATQGAPTGPLPNRLDNIKVEATNIDMGVPIVVWRQLSHRVRTRISA